MVYGCLWYIYIYAYLYNELILRGFINQLLSWGVCPPCINHPESGGMTIRNMGPNPHRHVNKGFQTSKQQYVVLIYIYLYPYKVVLQNSDHSWFYGDYYSSMANQIRHFSINWSFRQHPQNLSQLLFPVLLVNVGFITWVIPYMNIDEFMWVISVIS